MVSLTSQLPIRGAYVHLLTGPSYLPGLLVLHKTHLHVKSVYPFVALVTPAVGDDVRLILRSRGIIVRDIENLRPAGRHILVDHDRRFEDTWSKLRAFELLEYDRVVLRDSDMLLRYNTDDLFEMELADGAIAACHACTCNPRRLAHYPRDWIPGNCAYTPLTHPSCLASPTQITPASPRTYTLLNSGLVVLTPSIASTKLIGSFLASNQALIASFGFPDQDLLAHAFRGAWKPLPWAYNGLKTLRRTHAGVWRDDEVRCVHYIFEKPWEKRPPPKGAGIEGEFDEVDRWWWAEFDGLVEELEGPKAKKFVLEHVGGR